ncbi:TRAP transporter small permease [Microbacterium sp. NPDC055910]|uniref:TRAP transporter small permease n=1 Tax=Microbacterium sp. NPDC055910 TaxID=3345659 RepID=UPI0035DC5C7E
MTDESIAAPEAVAPRRGLFGTIVAAVTIVSIFAMMVHVVLNALFRAFFNQPIFGTLEYTQFWYIPLIAALGIALAQVNNEHIEASLLFDRLPRVARPIVEIVLQVLTLVVAVLFAYFGALMAIESAEIGRTAGVSGVAIWPATFFLPIAFAAFAVILTIQLIRGIRRMLSHASAATGEPEK